uniref:Uncharacterized protein n=1 Tax=Arundo donax TaxID=35708 RepID=A0A0A8ZQQ9_ARUDO
MPLDFFTVIGFRIHISILLLKLPIKKLYFGKHLTP